MNKNVKNLKGKLIDRRRNTQVKKVKQKCQYFLYCLFYSFVYIFFISFIAKRQNVELNTFKTGQFHKSNSE